MHGAERDDDDFRPPLPPEDRVWRHPAEVAAGLRAAATTEVKTLQTPMRHAFAIAALGAVGGAMVVTGLFLTLGGAGVAPASVATEVVAVQRVVPVPRSLPADEWPAVVASEVAPGVVTVEVDGRTGSAVAFKSDGYLLTSQDLVRDSDEVTVRLGDDGQATAAVLGTDPISGLSVIEVTGREFAAAPLALFKMPEVGEPAVAVSGDPDAEFDMGTLTANDGRIRVAADRNLHGVLELDVELQDGTTGGALVDDTGAVIGIVVDAGSSTATHAVPIAWARKIADDLMVWGEGRHPWLGITGVDLDAAQSDAAGLDGTGIRVETVISGGPADLAGIQRGDVLSELGGTPLASMSDLILELRRHPTDAALAVSVHRDGSASEVRVSLGVRSSRGTD